jgi:hypothetical protein
LSRNTCQRPGPPDIIIVVTTPAALAIKKATTTIPIVHPNAIDPLNTGLIASLAHPGGNLTGGGAVDRRSQRKTAGNTKESGAEEKLIGSRDDIVWPVHL